MATDVLMPKLSDTMEEGKILKWLKHPGDRVQSGDVIAEVETDKANMEIEAFEDGILSEVRFGEGESAAVGAVIAVLGAGEDAAAKASARSSAAAEAEPAREAPAAPPARPAPVRSPARPPPPPAPVRSVGSVERVERTAPAAQEGEEGRVKASPLAKKVAVARGIDVTAVRGSGPGGRVLRADVENAAGAEADRRPPAPGPARATPTAGPVTGRRELSRMRRTTAKRMAEAKRDIPHFYVSADLDVEEALRLREGLVALGAAFDGITVTHLLVKACGLALRRVPEMNASPDGDAIVVHEHVHVGIATATDQGLIVPVVRDVDRASLADVVAASRAVVGRARAGKPGPDDLSGATFTISNLGMFPVSHFAAVVNPPQAAILAIGTTRAVPVVRGGAVVPGQLMTVTLSCDHRVVDGVLAGRFVAELKTIVENPLALVV